MLSFDEVQQRQQRLRALFNKFRESSKGLSDAQCVKFAVDSGLVDKKVKAADVSLAFSSVKIGKKNMLDFERFEVTACLFMM